MNRMSKRTTCDFGSRKAFGRSWRRVCALGARKGARSMTSADALLARLSAASAPFGHRGDFIG
jgi:hypothetical protein